MEAIMRESNSNSRTIASRSPPPAVARKRDPGLRIALARRSTMQTMEESASDCRSGTAPAAKQNIDERPQASRNARWDIIRLRDVGFEYARRHPRRGLARRMGGGDNRCAGSAQPRSSSGRGAARPQCDGVILNANGDPQRSPRSVCRSSPTRSRALPGRSPACSPRSTGPPRTGPPFPGSSAPRGIVRFCPRDLGGAAARRAPRERRAACGRRLGRARASRDRFVERRVARRTPPCAGRRGLPQGRSVDGALPAGDGRLVDRTARSLLQRQHRTRISSRPRAGRRSMTTERAAYRSRERNPRARIAERRDAGAVEADEPDQLAHQ